MHAVGAATYLGLDVHRKSVAAPALDAEGRQLSQDVEEIVSTKSQAGAMEPLTPSARNPFPRHAPYLYVIVTNALFYGRSAGRESEKG